MHDATDVVRNATPGDTGAPGRSDPTPAHGAAAVHGATPARAPGATNGALQEQLRVLRVAYAARLPEKIARLEELLEQLSNEREEGTTALHASSFHHTSSETALQAAHRLAHNLTGSGATYGFSELSQTARTLEQHLKSITAARATRPSTRPSPEEQAQTATLLAALKAAALQPDAALQGDVLDAQAPSSGDSPWRWADDKVVFCVAGEPHLAADLARQIGYFGYAVRAFSSCSQNAVEEMKAAIERDLPAALIVDAALHAEADESNESNEANEANGSNGDTDAVGVNTDTNDSASEDARAVGAAARAAIVEIQEARQASGAARLPVLFIAERGDIKARLRAVRAGAAAYFTKPVDVAEVIDTLDGLTAQETPEPYRILIVDDETDLSTFLAWSLQAAGMKVEVVNDPLRIMQPLTDFRPDLILMDVYMPLCSGLELATVIRQQHDYVGIPIVFLSGETDVGKQMATMRLGADDFLTKPIQPEHLVAAVAARAQRSRSVRSFMVRDSLTGLLNHTTTKEHLDIEVTRARRRHLPLAFAMLDIDRFKSINDTYGHLTGDRVIKNLSRLLGQRLRKTDIIGRYGGEEFAVILSDTDGPTARRVLDEIRAGFSQVKQQAGGTEFSVTFSCGIATFPGLESAARLNDAADKALYEAKRAGRNRVVLSER